MSEFKSDVSVGETSNLGTDVSRMGDVQSQKKRGKVVGRDVRFQIGRLQTSDVEENVEKCGCKASLVIIMDQNLLKQKEEIEKQIHRI